MGTQVKVQNAKPSNGAAPHNGAQQAEQIPSGAAAMQSEIERLRALLAQANQPRALRCKVSSKGGVSVYGLNARFPVTLYEDQWTRLLDYADSVRAFMKEHKAEMAVKPPKA